MLLFYSINFNSNSSESTTAIVPSPSTDVNNESLDVFIDTFPTTRTYTKNDLSPGKTGFLPVSIEIDGPNFLTYYSDELGNLYEQPITHNGKYKIVPYESNPSGDPDQGFPIAGFLPKYLANQASGDYDLNIQIPNSGGGDTQPPEITPNTCYFGIDNEVVEYVNSELRPEEERGTLRLPSTDAGLMQKVDFDIGNKNYATEVAIDLSGISFPEPTIESNLAVLDITPAVLEFVNNNPQGWGEDLAGKITLPNEWLNALTDYEDNGKGYATRLVINVGSLKGFFNLDTNTRNISQNGTYQIGNFDNNAEDIEIERQNNRGMSIRLIEDGEEDGTKSEGDTKDDPTPTPNPNANYTMGTFTVNVQPRLEDKTVTVTTTDGTQTVSASTGYDGLGTVTINSNVSIPKTLVKYISWCEGLNSTNNLSPMVYPNTSPKEHTIFNIKEYLTNGNGYRCMATGSGNFVSPGSSYFYIQKISFGFNINDYGGEMGEQPSAPGADVTYTDCWLIGAQRQYSTNPSNNLSFYGRQEAEDKRMIVFEYNMTQIGFSGISTNCICLDPNNHYITKLNYESGGDSINQPWALLPANLYDFDFDFDEIYNSLPELPNNRP